MFPAVPITQSHALLGLEVCRYTSLSPWVAFTTKLEIFNKTVFVMKVEQNRASKNPLIIPHWVSH